MIRYFWVSCSKFTVGVDVNNGIIVNAAPIVKKFVGQPFENLLNWIRSKPQFKNRRLKEIFPFGRK